MATEIRRGWLKQVRATKEIGDLTLLDDKLMTLVLNDNAPALNLIFRTILKNEDLRLLGSYIDKEEPKNGKQSNYLSLILADPRSLIYYIELHLLTPAVDMIAIQGYDYMKNLGFLKGAVDENFVKKRLIYIMPQDVMGKGKPIYTYSFFENVTKERLGDHEQIIFINTAYEDCDSDIGKLMHDFRCSDPTQMYFQRLANDVDCCKYGAMRHRLINVIDESYREIDAAENSEEVSSEPTAQNEQE